MTATAMRYLPRAGERDLDEVLAAWLLRFDEMPYVALFHNLPREPEKVPAASAACCGTAGTQMRARGRATWQRNSGTPTTMRWHS